jgi:hypothetical protein
VLKAEKASVREFNKWEIISKCFSTALSADNLRTSSGAGRVVAVIVDSPIRFARDHHHRPWWIRSLRRKNVSNASRTRAR